MCNTSLQGQYVLLGTLCCKQRKKKHLDLKKEHNFPLLAISGSTIILREYLLLFNIYNK